MIRCVAGRTALGAALGAWLLAVVVHAGREPPPAGAAAPPLPRLLSETGLYRVGRAGEIDPGNRPFSPQYPLWSDGLTKRRWIYLPAAAAIDGRDEHAWEFPVGTKIWKEFARGDRRVETRLLWRVSAAEWRFASYVWNAAGSDAELAPEAGLPGVVEVAAGRRHAIPSRTDCIACHGGPGRVAPLGFSALQLSTDRDPNALHGEPLAPGMVTNATLLAARLLTGARADLVSRPPRVATHDPATRTVLGYLAVNCGTCHNGKGEIAALAPVIRPVELTRDADAVADALRDRRTRWQVAGDAEGESRLLRHDLPERSALYVRMRSRSPSSQMPPLGTLVRDEEALRAIAAWIAARP